MGALTPTSVATRGFRVSAVSVPYGDTSGDLHDWSSDGDHLTVTLADVMGKEQPAAILAAGIRAALRQHRDAGPADAVRAAEPALSEDLVATSAFATLFHARVAFDSGAWRRWTPGTDSWCTWRPTVGTGSSGRTTSRSACTPAVRRGR